VDGERDDRRDHTGPGSARPDGGPRPPQQPTHGGQQDSEQGQADQAEIGGDLGVLVVH